MIVVDSSVWIDHLRDRETWQVLTLRRLIRRDMAGPILVGDIIMYEVLAGLRSAQAAQEVRELLETLLLVSMLDFDLVPTGRRELPGAPPPRDHSRDR